MEPPMAFYTISILVCVCAVLSMLYDQWLRGTSSEAVSTFRSLLFLLMGFYMCYHVVGTFLEKRLKEQASPLVRKGSYEQIQPPNR